MLTTRRRRILSVIDVGGSTAPGAPSHPSAATLVVAALAANLGVLWIAMEGTPIPSAVLIGYHGHRHGLEAAWKYIIVTTIGISFGLFGTVLVYAAPADVMGGAGAVS